jgi:hypothetical protein
MMESTLGDLGKEKSTEKSFDLSGFGVGRLRGGERAAAFAGDEGGSEGGGQLGAGREP